MKNVPKGWRRTQLSEIAEIVRGSSPRPAGDPEYFNGDFLPWITVADVTCDNGMYLEGTRSKLTKAGAEYTRILKPETLILTNSGATLGVPKITRIRAGANDGIAVFLNIKGVVDKYLYFFLQTQTRYFRERLAPGVGQPNLNTELIGGVLVNLPSESEQIKIVNILVCCDAAEKKQEDLLAARVQHKRGLMQQLLTGQTRFKLFKAERWRTYRLFISYSHDTPAHKKWVGELASKLVSNGVEVLLDQWEIGFGDDIPKFMEKAVSEADCVLMICTEAYVRKADEGKGGAGYEAMIVTGELVRNLGTAKFVPVIRQENGTKLVPKSMSTRFFADFSEGQSFDEQIEALLRKIHKVPKFKKPPLGKNPFAAEAATDVAAGVVTNPASIPPQDVTTQYYRRASDAAHGNDLLAWRRVLKEARQVSWQQLQKWRANYDAKIENEVDGQLPPMADGGLGSVSPLLAVVLAGVESANDKFKNQVEIVDELLLPPQWNSSGYDAVLNFPDTLVFLYQALHGAVCMETGQASLAVQLARSQFRCLHSNEKSALIDNRSWVGWPGSIHENCTVCWDFLLSLPENHPWLNEIFGSKDDYVAALSAYYALLNLMEMTAMIAVGQTAAINGGELHFNVPLCGFSITRGLRPKAYRILIRDKIELKQVWEGVGVDTKTMAKYWPVWVQSCKDWLRQVYRRSSMFGSDLYHEDLFKEPGLRTIPPNIIARVG